MKRKLKPRGISSSSGLDQSLVEPDNHINLMIREATFEDFKSLLQNDSSPRTTSCCTEEKLVTSLPEKELNRLLNRLPEIKNHDDDQRDFFMREKSIKPPVTADTIQVEFPPLVKLEKSQEIKEEEGKLSGSELAIIRYSPEEELDRPVPSITITFSQPMVAVSGIDECDTVPFIIISPLPKKGGKFKWLGTKTLVYEANYTFDMSTRFTITVKKGTSSQNGGILGSDFSFSFETPRLYVKDYLPNINSMPVNEFPVFYAEFDQDIEPSAVLPFISTLDRKASLLFDGKSANSLLQEHIKKMMDDYGLQKRHSSMYQSYLSKLSSAPESRHLWFTFDFQTNPVSVGGTFDIVINQGVIGTEGPLPSLRNSIIRVVPYPLFTQDSMHGGNVPMEPFTIVFSNAIDVELFLESMITVSPLLENMELYPNGSTLTIKGKSKGRTTYKFFLKGIVDVWGQVLPDTIVEFQVGTARQSLQAFGSGIMVLDPTMNTKPTYSFVTVNVDSVHLRVCQVEPSLFNGNVLHYSAYNRSEYNYPGEMVLDTTLSISGEPDEPFETQVDLSQYLQFPDENLGHLLVYVEPTQTSWKGDWAYRPSYCAWIQSTKISLDCSFDTYSSNLYFWVNSLSDGSIIKNDVEFIAFDEKCIPDPETGIGKAKIQGGSSKLIVRYGNDTCFIPGVGLYISQYNTNTIAHIFNDRGLYKPNETVSIKGIVRHFELQDSGPTIHIPSEQSTHYIVKDARGEKYYEGDVDISNLGTFDFTFQVPDNANLGDHKIEFAAFPTRHSFKVQEFRTPEFKSSCSITPSTYIVNGPPAVCTTKAEYYSGGAIGGGKCTYSIKQRFASYTPPNRYDYTFGEGRDPYMGFYRIKRNVEIGAVSVTSTNFEGTTDGKGEHQIAISPTESSRPNKFPITVLIESTIQDINRQTISASASFLVHPCKYYCGIKFSKQFVKPNIPVTASLITTDIAGNIVSGMQMKLTVSTQVSVKKGFKFVDETVQVFEQILTSSQDGPIEVPVKFEKGGCYAFKVEIVDPETGLTNSSKKNLYISGGETRGERIGKRIIKDTLLIIQDKTEYQVGDIAKLLIQSNLDGKCEGLAIVSLYNVIQHIPITIEPEVGYTEIEIEITKNSIPNINLNVEVVGSQSRVDAVGNILTDLPKQPAYASAQCDILVSNITNSLTVETKPEKEYLTPGAESFIDVMVKDPITGEPIQNSEVCILAVDEAVLSLTGYTIANPLKTFTRRNHPILASYSLRTYLFVKSYDSVIADSEKQSGSKKKRKCMRGRSAAGNSNDEESDDSDPSISVRSNFNPLAVFSPKSITDSSGKARVSFTLPDNLTSYRITAVAIKGESCFGIHESSMVAQLPLAIRPSLPRFLNFGDRAEFTCVLQSQVPIDIVVNAAINFTNLNLLDSSKKGLKVKLPAMGRIELRFPMSTDCVGIARFQIGVSIATHGLNFSDAVEKEIRILTPATTEAFATYGEMDGDCSVFQPVKAPENVYPQFGSLKITTSSTALSSLTDSFLYLYNYPYECCEQIASRILSIVALKDILHAFQVPEIPTKEAIDNKINGYLSTLASRQLYNGTFGYWSEAEVSPYVTCHVAHAVARCKIAGYTLNERMMSKLIPTLKIIDNYCLDYNNESLRSIKAYSYYVLALLGESDVKSSAENLFNEVKLEGNFEYLAWIGTAIWLANGKVETKIVKEIMKHLEKNVNETAQTANFITSYGDVMANKHVMLHSNRRTDGICLEAFINILPKSHLIPKFVKGLLAHKKKGRWNNTQENVFILLALNTYFNVHEGISPDFVVNLWLGEDYCGEQTFKGRSKDENQLDLPMSLLTEVHEGKTLVISKKGPGRLYYRIGMDYAPKNLLFDALDYGFEIQRTFEHVTDPTHVTFDKEHNTWRFKAGELIRIKLRMTNTSRRYHVALVDFLPAGLEPINTELKGTPALSGTTNRKSRRCWWNPIWYEHYNMRDERVEAFSSLLQEGTHEFIYLSRATTIGSFVIPGVKAEEMYSPEIFGRSATEFAEVFE